MKNKRTIISRNRFIEIRVTAAFVFATFLLMMTIQCLALNQVKAQESSQHQSVSNTNSIYLLKVTHGSLPSGTSFYTGGYQRYADDVDSALRSLSGYYPAAVSGGELIFYKTHLEGYDPVDTRDGPPPMASAEVNIYQAANPYQFNSLSQFSSSSLSIPVLLYRSTGLDSKTIKLDRLKNHSVVQFLNYPAFAASDHSDIYDDSPSIIDFYWVDLGEVVALVVLRCGVAAWANYDLEEYRNYGMAILSSLRFEVVEVPAPSTVPAPDSAQPRPCKASIHLPVDLKPGEVLSPSYTITDQDGNAPKGEIYPVLYINGVQAHSVVWDGNEAKIELQVSCQGQALSVTAIMPAYGTLPPDDFDSVIPPYDSTPDGLSKIPLPENASQAMAGLLIPGILSIILGILGQSGMAVAPSGRSGSTKGRDGTAYDLGDGREYYEGQSYTFDDGKEYKFTNGGLIPIRELGNGETYTDPDGNRKIWIGGQRWHEADWRKQEPTNKERQSINSADWAYESTQLNPDMVASQQQYELETAAISHLGRMQNASVRHGMATEGAIDDMYGRAGELLEQIRNGEKFDSDKIARIRSYIGNRISGFTPGPGDYPPPEKSWWADGGAWAEGLEESGRNISKAQNSDGSTSWAGLGGRLGIGILTGGASEWVFVPMASTYSMKDAVDNGASGFGAFKEAAFTAIVQDLVGRGIGMGISGASGAYHGGTAGAWQGLKSAAADQARQFGDLFSGKAWQATGQKLVNSISNGSQRFANIITGREGYTGPSLQQIKEGTQKGVDRIFGRQPKLNATEQAKLKQFNDAVNSGDPNKVAELYRDGGMKELAELQRKGVISPESARKCNSILKTQVDESIREGTRNSIIDVQNQTQVRVKEVIVADSGSSAKSQVTRLNTDADRTLIPTYNESDLMQYANRNNLTRAEAYNDLCRKLNEAHTSNVGQSLKGKGLTAKDVDFGSYDRIGSASGQADSYPTSFTNARTGVDGTAEVTRVSADGNKIYQPYKTSGQAAVDANQLNVNNYGTGRFDADPTKILPGDTKPVLEQQIKSIFDGGKTGNPEALAKSVERFHKQASIGQHSTTGGLPDQVAIASRNSIDQASERMVNTSRMLRNVGTDPGKLDWIIKQNGYSNRNEFMQECIDFLKHAESSFSVVP